MLQLTSEQLVEPLSIAATNKGLACFLNVHIPDSSGGWQRVKIRRKDLHKLDHESALDAITKTNQTAQPVEVVAVCEPLSKTFVKDKQEGRCLMKQPSLTNSSKRFHASESASNAALPIQSPKHLLDP